MLFIKRDDIFYCEPLFLDALDALSEIAVGNQETIDALILLLEDKNLSNDLIFFTSRALSRITSQGDRKTINTFTLLALQADLSRKNSSYLIRYLGKVTVPGDKEVIDLLILLLLQSNLHYYSYADIEEVLISIAFQDRATIDSLTCFLTQEWLDDKILMRIADVLIGIAKEDLNTIDTLSSLIFPNDLSEDRLLIMVHTLRHITTCRKVTEIFISLIERENFKDFPYSFIESSLSEIITSKKMPSLIWRLKNHVTNEVRNSNYEKFNSCFKTYIQQVI
jgi:hypothetical protein